MLEPVSSKVIKKDPNFLGSFFIVFMNEEARMKEKNIILSTASQGKTLICEPTTLQSHKQLVYKIESLIEVLNSTKDNLVMVENLCGLKNY